MILLKERGGKKKTSSVVKGREALDVGTRYAPARHVAYSRPAILPSSSSLIL